MKTKKLFGGIAILAIAAVSAWNVNLSVKSGNVSNLSLYPKTARGLMDWGIQNL